LPDGGGQLKRHSSKAPLFSTFYLLRGDVFYIIFLLRSAPQEINAPLTEKVFAPPQRLVLCLFTAIIASAQTAPMSLSFIYKFPLSAVSAEAI